MALRARSTPMQAVGIKFKLYFEFEFVYLLQWSVTAEEWLERASARPREADGTDSARESYT